MGSVPKRLVDPTAIRAEDAQGDWVETSSRFAGQNRLNRINFRYVGPHLSEYLKLEIADVDQPQPAASGVLLYVEVCGICGSDVLGDDGSSGRRRPPIVMGHEAAGTIVAVGSEVRQWHPGDRVTFDSFVYCGSCPFCLRPGKSLRQPRGRRRLLH